jgi:hypothetical protein
MSVRPGWDDQFAEDEDKRRERWRQTKAKRIAAGKCWQCALPFAECRCWVARQGNEAWKRPASRDCRNGK